MQISHNERRGGQLWINCIPRCLNGEGNSLPRLRRGMIPPRPLSAAKSDAKRQCSAPEPFSAAKKGPGRGLRKTPPAMVRALWLSCEKGFHGIGICCEAFCRRSSVLNACAGRAPGLKVFPKTRSFLPADYSPVRVQVNSYLI